MSKKKTTEDKNVDLQIDFAIDNTRCALCECENVRVHFACIRERSIHRARHRALCAYYVNLLLKNWYVSVARIVKEIL